RTGVERAAITDRAGFAYRRYRRRRGALPARPDLLDRDTASLAELAEPERGSYRLHLCVRSTPAGSHLCLIASLSAIEAAKQKRTARRVPGLSVSLSFHVLMMRLMTGWRLRQSNTGRTLPGAASSRSACSLPSSARCTRRWRHR